MTDAPQATPPAPSPSTSTEAVDKASAPGRVGPVKLAGKRPAPVEESKPARVGPEKITAKRAGS